MTATVVFAPIQADSVESASADQFVDELNALGVHFLAGGNPVVPKKRLDPLALVIALASSDEARLRLALIPLFLLHPDYSAYVNMAAERVSAPAQIVLKCYYTAACLLQQKHRAQLAALWGATQPLPDLFSVELGLPTSDSPDAELRNLADRQRVLSGRAINWLGTYDHAVQRLIRHEEQRTTWST